MSFVPSEAKIYERDQDPRLGNLLVSREQSNFVLLGYPDDEGVSHNGGRVGTAKGPDALRESLFKTTLQKKIHLYDGGNLAVGQFADIGARHEACIQEASKYYQEGKKLISIGGGHDYGYPDAKAFYEKFKDQRPLLINFDAHLDLRPVETKISSGTPFYRFLSEKPQVDFYEIGLLKVCNQPEHLDFLQRHGGKALFYEDWLLEGKTLLEKFCEIMGEEIIKERAAFLSIDIDAFSSSIAPGCSQSWPFSMQAQDFFPLFELLLSRFDVKGIGIYEYAPNLDENFKTQRLATQIVHHFLHH
tara:strand:- start:5185 stop:6090 length:906 start_codon:yes stop_codon:yes gene_type:complete